MRFFSIGVCLFLLGSIVSVSMAAVGINASACKIALTKAHLDSNHPLSSLSKQQMHFLTDQLAPVVGMRLLFEGPEQLRECSVNGKCLEIKGSGTDKSLRVEWSESVFVPRIVSSEHTKVLILPAAGIPASFSPSQTEGLIKQFLMGHSFHPYTKSQIAQEQRKSLGEPEVLLKHVQDHAIRAAEHAIEAGDRKFLFVAPTGTGKTEVLLAVLSKQLARSKNALHVVVADQNTLVDQLAKSVGLLKKEGLSPTPFEIEQWGDSFGSEKIASLVSRVSERYKTTGVHTVLVTTIQSLKHQINAEAGQFSEPQSDRQPQPSEVHDSNYALLRSVLGTFIFDEVHHAGAEQARALIQQTIEHKDSSAFFYGTTATPIHQDASIQDLFDGRAFWAYLDTFNDYVAKNNAYERPLTSVVEQLNHAIQMGELTPFDKFYFINPSQIERQGIPFFVRANDQHNTRMTINPEYRVEVAHRLAPLFLKHKKGFVSVSTIAETQEWVDLFQKIVPGRKFAAWHSETKSSEDIKKRLEESDINFVVTVRKFDEGVDVPGVSFWADLNRTIAPRQLLQRAGRTLRISAGKEVTDIATVMEINENDLREKIYFITSILDGTLRTKQAHEELTTSDEKSPSSKDAEKLASSYSTENIDLLKPIDEARYLKELEALQAQLKDFWNKRAKKQTAAELAAEELNEVLRLSLAVPKDLYAKVHLHRHKLEFRRLLTPQALAYVFSIVPRGATELAKQFSEFVEAYGNLPNPEIPMEVPLSKAVIKKKESAEFSAALTPLAKLTLELDGGDYREEAVLAKFQDFAQAFSKLPSSFSKDTDERALAKALKLYEHSLSFWTALNDASKQVFIPHDEAALYVHEFSEKHGSNPRADAQDPFERWVFEVHHFYSQHQGFLSTLYDEFFGSAPKSVEKIEPAPASVAPVSESPPPESTTKTAAPVHAGMDVEEIALQLMDYYDKNQSIPQKNTENAFEDWLADTLHSVSNIPEFLEVIPSDLKEAIVADQHAENVRLEQAKADQSRIEKERAEKLEKERAEELQRKQRLAKEEKLKSIEKSKTLKQSIPKESIPDGATISQRTAEEVARGKFVNEYVEFNERIPSLRAGWEWKEREARRRQKASGLPQDSLMIPDSEVPVEVAYEQTTAENLFWLLKKLSRIARSIRVEKSSGNKALQAHVEIDLLGDVISPKAIRILLDSFELKAFAAAWQINDTYYLWSNRWLEENVGIVDAPTLQKSFKNVADPYLLSAYFVRGVSKELIEFMGGPQFISARKIRKAFHAILDKEDAEAAAKK